MGRAASHTVLVVEDDAAVLGLILSGAEDARAFGERQRLVVRRKPFRATELLSVVELEARP